jgi:hypothetical protein
MEARLPPLACEIIHHIGDLDGVSGRRSERLVHVGQERRRRQACLVRDVDQALGEGAGARPIRHERAGADLHVLDETVEPRRQLFRQDRGRDQVDGLDRRSHVPDGVEPPVGGREVVRLADDGAAHLAHHAPKRVEVGLRTVARNGVELVERAARVAEAAPRDHRNEAAASRDRRREREADRVADAAGRMLVEHGAG